MSKRIALIGFLGLLALALAGVGNSQPPAPLKPDVKLAAEDLFVRQVQPLLKAKCIGCHGDDPEDIAGDLDLRTREAMLKGGESGPALVPGNAEKSLLYQAVLRTGKLVMPPKKTAALTPQETADLRNWIDGGATVPSTPVTKKTDDWKTDPRDVWAFQPVKRTTTPHITQAGRLAAGASLNTPIDAFILEKLSAAGIPPAPRADRDTLIRRAFYDLTGLPPSLEELKSTLSDKSPDWFDKLIERLLASPHYGEHWGRHWLDVVRYSDSSGYSNDYERPNAWRYRDYVIRSFNADKPYDRFLIEQIAGDELASRERERPEDDPEPLIAVGFLRMGPWEHTGMSVAAVTRQLFLDDVTESVGLTFLGLSVGFARCHDHKFDPIPTRDYYRLQAVFAPVQFEDRAVGFLSSENTAGFEQSANLVRDRLKANQVRVQGAAAKEQEEVARLYKKRQEYYSRELTRYQETAFSVASGGLKTRVATPDTHVLVGGSLTSPAEKVAPGVLSKVAISGDHSITADTTGRRLALAKWLARPDHPLTARVMVNRVWQYHFGKGLVETSNNFGKMGKRPTHPELLDWLATEFATPSPLGGEGGVRGEAWSIKNLHRLIMRSAVYQQSSDHPEADKLARLDPDNKLVARFMPRRLTSEELRDSVLAAAGELNPMTGGPPVLPEINIDVALQPRQIMGTLAPIWEPSPTRAMRNRRTVYTYQVRGLPNPLLEVFNAAAMNTSCDRRDSSTVTPQVFALFNSQFAHDTALAMAHRIASGTDDRAEQVRRAFSHALGRLPSAKELSLSATHLEKMLEHHRKVSPVRRQLPNPLILSHVGELTGKRFEFVTDWDLGKYEFNLSPADVPTATRALAELCLVLLNSNEFIYVY